MVFPSVTNVPYCQSLGRYFYLYRTPRNSVYSQTNVHFSYYTYWNKAWLDFTLTLCFAIFHRNCWMVEIADVVVAYVLHDWGGAATTLGHALKKKSG